jgi:hypothetical protein
MKAVWLLAGAMACQRADRGSPDELVGGDDDTAAPAEDDSGVRHIFTDHPDGDGLPNGVGNGDDSGDTGETGETGGTGGTIDTAGDCPVTIPKDVVVIDDDEFLTTDGVVAYVCKNKVLSLTGSGATVFVGVGGQLWMNSSGNTVYARTGAELAFYDSDNDVYIEDGVDVEDDSEDATLPLVICSSVTFENEPDCN